MNVTIQQAEKLLTGDNQQFTTLSFSMLLTRLKNLYAIHPSEMVLRENTAEINKFLEKYHTLMGTDCAVIEKL